ncbi:MAG: iron(III) transport system substrate-binding protein [Alphaproteobacteria bacterium]|jgi:iron(III) transport system substrate-binding protein|nr:iron(III) transport system substrate-binding protein [Alphaproteobacteria bacterium]
MNTLSRRSLWSCALLVVAGLAGGTAPALAQPVDMAAAKKEGRVVWYCSVPIETAQKVATMFEQKTGIKVELFRSGGSNILRRFQQEADGGKVFVDVITHSEPAAARMMTKKGLFVPFKATDFDKVPAEVKDPQGYHVAQRLNVMAMYVRDDKVPMAERPKTWADLTAPRYKGKMVMADPSFSSLLISIVGTLAKEHGWQYFEKLRANDIMLVQGNQQVADMVKRGERSIAVGADAAYVGDSKKQGMAITTLYQEDGAFVIPSPSSVVKGAPNPNAAKAFADFMLSRAVQELFPHEYLYSARTDVAGPEGQPPLSAIKMHAIDYDYIEAQSSQIKKRFAEVLQ